jgi:hypothetical protein
MMDRITVYVNGKPMEPFCPSGQNPNIRTGCDAKAIAGPIHHSRRAAGNLRYGEVSKLNPDIPYIPIRPKFQFFRQNDCIQLI